MKYTKEEHEFFERLRLWIKDNCIQCGKIRLIAIYNHKCKECIVKEIRSL